MRLFRQPPSSLYMTSHIIPPEEFAAEKKPLNRLYLTIYEGILCTRRAQPQENFIEYHSKKGKVTYIREFDHIYGYLVNVRSHEEETLEGLKYRTMHFTFDNGSGNEIVLVVPLTSEFVARFAKCAPNFNFQKPIFIKVFPDRKTHTPVVIFQQGGENVPQAFTREKPNGLPQWEHDPVTGDWDNRAYWRFLFEVINSQLPAIEKCRQTIRTLHEENLNVSEPEQPVKEDDFDDDIPF